MAGAGCTWVTHHSPTLSPAALLYENYLFYTYPLAALLCGAALCLHRFLSEGRTKDGAAFFGLAGAVVLTQGLFHLVWLAALVAGVALARRGTWRQVALTAAIPLALAFGWYGKNLALFGSFSSSSWLGMNLGRVVAFSVSDDQRWALAKEGRISLVSLVPPFRALEDYRSLVPPQPATGIPALDQERKSTGPANFNNKAYLALSRSYLKDDLTLIRVYPRAYLRSVLFGFFYYLLPATDYPFSPRSMGTLRPAVDAFDRFVCLRLEGAGGTGSLAPGLALALPVLLLYGLARLVKPGAASDPAFRGTLLFLWGSILYVMLVGNLLEIGENNRFRFETDPFYVVLLGMALTTLATRRRRRSSGEG